MRKFIGMVYSVAYGIAAYATFYHFPTPKVEKQPIRIQKRSKERCILKRKQRQSASGKTYNTLNVC